jgi:hypothetical protein
LTGTLPGLAVATQRWIEALYALEAQAPVADFLIPAESAGRFPGGGSRTLVTCEGDEVSLGVVLEPRVVESLDEHDPRRALTRDNLAAYCTLTEEVMAGAVFSVLPDEFEVPPHPGRIAAPRNIGRRVRQRTIVVSGVLCVRVRSLIE